MKVGRFRLAAASDGAFRLDGGAMFGIVPQTLWKKRIPPDSLNRILLGLNILLVDNGSEVIIIDTGIGGKTDESFNQRFGVERKREAVEDLIEKGYKPGDIDKVILTHLHFDHTGGATRMDERGNVVPTYPSAVYFVQRAEWEDASDPNEITRASYIEENFRPLREFDRLEILDGDTQVSEGVRVELTGGHTRGHQIVRIESDGELLIHMGDLVPTSHHLPLPYIMGYDTFPLRTLEMRKDIYRKAVDGGWRLFFEHDYRPKTAQLVLKDGKISLDEKSIAMFGALEEP